MNKILTIFFINYLIAHNKGLSIKPYSRNLVICKPFLLLLITINTLPGFSQKLSRYYTSRPQETGTLYFIYPFDGFSNADEGSTLSFDITYLNGSDSAVLNFTCFSKETRSIDSLILYADQKIIAAKASKLMIERVKKKWKYRSSAVFYHKDLFEFITISSNPSIRIQSNEGDHFYKIRQKKWSRYSTSIGQVIYIIGSE
ncbi:MAG: hypothetical protein ACNA7V_06420 [Bacteroidales bacterium]